MKLIHLTDPHMVPKGRKLFGRDPRVVLDAAIADINAHHQRRRTAGPDRRPHTLG